MRRSHSFRASEIDIDKDLDLEPRLRQSENGISNATAMDTKVGDNS